MVLISSDSSLETSSLIGLGADSTSSLASFKPNEVTSLTALITAILLGAIFTVFQAYEYSHAAFGFSGNIYGANFFMATGFHGFHVVVGTIFLFICLMRTLRGHFSPESHLGFEAAAWYWHFVDVVWLFLFAAVYVWGG